jgi:2-polyprenyl-3-methyl-5-hydroxy-6-metoxy-1,4-benzoquinol methylase
MIDTSDNYPWQQLDVGLHLDSLHHDFAPEGLLKMIGVAPLEVLDVGCFCGGSGRWIKEQFPKARITGIEMIAKAAEIAAEAYDEVYVSKFEDVDTISWQGKFDAIIAADVLEHVYNPWAMLQRLKPLISQGGALYVSVPNIRNLNILMGLAKGEWHYSSRGILDITHIRFFTKTQACEMLEQTGWKVSQVLINVDPLLSQTFEGKDLDQIKNISTGKLRLENLNREDVLELMTIQFYIKATPAL